MSKRILHPETINAMIPLVQRIADDLQNAFGSAACILRSSSCEGRDREIADNLDSVQGFVYEFEKLGGTLRSYEPVRVDFMAEVEGEIGYVCWETGDTEGMHFHGAMERCEGLILSR